MATAPHPLVLRAREALARGDMRAVENAAEERLKTAGRDVNALELRFIVQQRRGQFGQAARTLDTVIGIDSHADWAYNERVQLLMAHGKREDAEKAARAALRANPRNAVAHQLFGSILSEQKALPAGEAHFRNALELSEPGAEVLLNLGLNLMNQGRLEEADIYLTRAHDQAPQDMKIVTSWSTLQEARGNLPRALELLERAEAATPPAEVTVTRARYQARAGKLQEALECLSAGNPLTGEMQLARGRLQDRLGNYSMAWQDFAVGKQTLLKQLPGTEYRADAVDALFSRCKQFVTRDSAALLPRARPRPDMAQPVFLMGFPRSGTGLVEQILCSHPAVAAGGELRFAGDMSKLAGNVLAGAERFPDYLSGAWTADNHYTAALFRDYYLARAEQDGLCKGTAFFTDRMPFNEIYLPVLKMAFPQAKIVRVIRHPLDVCVSMLANDTAHGFHCGYRLEDIAHSLAAYNDLLDHYTGELDLEVHVLRYESLIADHVGETRRLLDYLGLPFAESCVQFHQTRRHSPTASSAQIIEKLHDRSVGRYRNYVAELRAGSSRLEKLIFASGYTS